MVIEHVPSRLREVVRGTVVAPGDDAWEAVRQPWSRSTVQHPLAVVEPAGEADVAAVLALARATGATVAVQPTGHGASDSLEGAILLRMGAFDTIAIDVEARSARVGAGVLVGELLAALDGTGLVGPSGSSRIVSVAGLVLGGGHGWFTRLGGLGAQRVRRARVVLPSGEATWLDDADETLCLLRGAGGLVAIVIELELELLAVDELRGGAIDVPITDARAALRAAGALVDAAPGLAASVALLRVPDSPVLPEAIRGRSWCSTRVVLADVDDSVLDGVRDAAPVLADTVAPLLPSALHTVTSDPEEPGAAYGFSAYLPRLDEAAIEALVAARADDAIAPVVAVEIRLLGGAPRDRPTVIPPTDAAWLVYSVAPVPPASDGAPQRAATAALAERLATITTPRTLPTFLGTGPLTGALDADGLDRVHRWRQANGGEVLHPSRLHRGRQGS